MKNQIKKLCLVDAKHILDDRGQPPLWPLMVEIGAWYLNKCFLPELYETIESLKQIGKSKDEIATLFKAPSRLSYPIHQMHYSFGDLKGGKGVNLLIDLLDFIKFFRKTDIFCETGRNILWSNDDLNSALRTYSLTSLKNNNKSNEIRRAIGKLNTVLWLYTELITVGHHSICHEFHGPYKIGPNRWLIIREYYDLKLPDIWPFSKSMPANRIVTMEVYEYVVIKFDFFNHTESSSDLPSHLKAFLIGTENFEESLNTIGGIEPLLETLTEIITIGNRYIGDFKERDWLSKLIEVYFYCMKPLKSLLRKDWKPSSSIYEFIEAQKPDKEFDEFMEMIGRIMSGASSYKEATKMLVTHYLTNIGMGKEG